MPVLMPALLYCKRGNVQTKVESRCLLFGAAPYDNVKYMTAMMAKLYSDCPSLMFLPNVSEKEDLLNRTFSGMPGIYFEEGKINFSIGLTKYEEAFKKIEKAYNNPTTENLKHYAFESEYTEKFLQMVHKFKPKNAFISLLGPFSISEMLTDNADEHLLSDKNFRKLFIYTVCVKALWIIDKIKSKSSETVPIVLFEEPALLYYMKFFREFDESLGTFQIDSLCAMSQSETSPMTQSVLSRMKKN